MASVEAPQGELLYLVEADAGRFTRIKARCASFHNLALFPEAFRGDILTDFVFIEASFGVSVAGCRADGLGATRVPRGIVTSRYPRRPDGYGPEYRAAVSVLPDADGAPAAAGATQQDRKELAALCPTGAISVTGPLQVDRGRCIVCGRCVDRRPDRFGFDSSFEVATLGRRALLVPRDEEAALALVRAELSRRVRALRRSIHVRHVDAGSDGAEEWEVAALTNPVYDIQRLGIFFTASPRHADLLLVTGVGTAGMAGPLRRTYEAMPEPKVVLAAGTDAISGGLLRPSYAGADGIESDGAGRRLGSRFTAEPFQPAARDPRRNRAAHPGRTANMTGALLLVALVVWAVGAGARPRPGCRHAARPD